MRPFKWFRFSLRPPLLLQQGTYFATLVGLLGVGYIGHSTHWHFPSVGHSPAHVVVEGSDQHLTLHTTTVSVAGVGDAHAPSPQAMAEYNPIVFKSADSVSASGIEVETVNLSPLRAEVVSSAHVEYDRRQTAELSSRAHGVICRVLCSTGQKVSAGEVLAIVDAGEVGQLKSDFAKALFDRNLKQKTLDRCNAARDALPHKLILEAEGALQAANVELLSAEQALINLGFEIDSTDYRGKSEQQVIQRLRTLGLADEKLQATLNSIQSSNLLPIRSPIDGIVIGQDISVGETVNSETPFIQVSDVSRVWVTVDIHKENAAAIRLGQPVEFTPDGSDQTIVGEVGWISTQVDEKTRTLRVRAELQNPLLPQSGASGLQMYLLRANMFGTASVQIRQQSAVTVTRDCLHTDNGKTLVFVQVDDETFEPRQVTCGISKDQLVEVIGSVAPGNVVASRGSQMLKSELLLAKAAGGVN